MERNGSDTDRRLRAMEAAFDRERKQRDLLEKKYARLKRRYVRLERSHTRLLMESHRTSDNGVQSPSEQSETSTSVEATPNSRTSTFSLIDLTSPRPGSGSETRSDNGSRDNISTSVRSSQSNFLASDDICAESPSSSQDTPDLSTRELHHSDDQEEKDNSERSWRRSTDRLYSTPTSRRRLHLDFTLPTGLGNQALPSTPRRVQQRGLQSDQATSSHSPPLSPPRSTTRNIRESRTRTRPRLRLHDHSPERTAARAYGYELEQELEPRAHRHGRYRWASDLSPEHPSPSPVQPSLLTPTNPSPLPPTVPSPAPRPRAESNEEASLALARYLQQEENIAAYAEYEARLHREYVEHEYEHQLNLHSSSSVSGLTGHQRNIDPDNMTYEELLRLGEEVGDVKKERWRQMAVQVLSSLPTHHWTHGNGDDTCIICQYNFVPNDRAMTLPCAHVFHEDCVDGWIRENNSCPLCKREIAPM